MAVDDERRAGEEARQAVTVLERKRIALQTELEDVRTLLETVSIALVYPPSSSLMCIVMLLRHDYGCCVRCAV